MSSDDSFSEALVTSADFARVLTEHEELVRRLAETEKKLDAYRLLLGNAKFERLRQAETAPDDRQRPTWPELLERLLKDSPDGLTYKQLKEMIGRSPLAEDLERSPNNFFNSIKRLERQHRVVRRGKLVFWPALLTQKLAAGGMIEEPPKDDELGAAVRSGVPALVMRVLSKSPRPLTASEVVEAAESDPEGRGLLAYTNQGVYAALSRLARRKVLRRLDDKRYVVVNDYQVISQAHGSPGEKTKPAQIKSGQLL